jgi:hypothetical protein
MIGTECCKNERGHPKIAVIPAQAGTHLSPGSSAG